MNEKILVVDDEKEIADLLEVYLKNDNYIVHKYYNGIEALECIQKTEIDLAILDVMLPDIDGFRICQKIRENYYFPVIMLTAKINFLSALRKQPVVDCRNIIRLSPRHHMVYAAV